MQKAGTVSLLPQQLSPHPLFQEGPSLTSSLLWGLAGDDPQKERTPLLGCHLPGLLGPQSQKQEKGEDPSLVDIRCLQEPQLPRTGLPRIVTPPVATAGDGTRTER